MSAVPHPAGATAGTVDPGVVSFQEAAGRLASPDPGTCRTGAHSSCREYRLHRSNRCGKDGTRFATAAERLAERLSRLVYQSARLARWDVCLACGPLLSQAPPAPGARG